MPVSEEQILYASDTDEAGRRVLARRAATGKLVRLYSGAYTADVDSPPQDTIRRNLWHIVGREFPGAVITDASIADPTGGTGHELFVVANRRRSLALPGMTIKPRVGQGHIDLDVSLPDGLWLASEPRALLDNLVQSRPNATGRRRTLGQEWVEVRLDRICEERGEAALNSIRDIAREMASKLDREKQMDKLDSLISATLTTHPSSILTTPQLRARASGEPFDTARIQLFQRLVEDLHNLAPATVSVLKADESRRALLPFYEAYFSNYIEGTEFTLLEAADIIFKGDMPLNRPADAHDISGTFKITNSLSEMSRTPSSSEDLLVMLKERHAVLMGGRPEVGPGKFKERANRAGSTEFVAPTRVLGTLQQGFDLATNLIDPFSRAVYLMFLLTEVHPFTDGNGRIARIFMNAELVSAGQARIVIPTVYRLNYLSALKAATQRTSNRPLIAGLSFAQRWTGRMNWSDAETAFKDLERTNALRDAQEAESAGIRLELP